MHTVLSLRADPAGCGRMMTVAGVTGRTLWGHCSRQFPQGDLSMGGRPRACARRALQPRACDQPGSPSPCGSPLSRGERSNPSTSRGIFLELVQRRVRPPLPFQCGGARPCLGHQGAPGPRSAARSPGGPSVLKPAELISGGVRRPQGNVPVRGPSALPAVPGICQKKNVEATQTPSPGNRPHSENPGP